MSQLGRGARDFGQPALVSEQVGQAGVQPGPLAGQQVGVDRFPQQRVPERVSLLAIGHEQLLRDRFPDRVVVFKPGEPGRLPGQLVVHPPAGDRRGAQHLLGRG